MTAPFWEAARNGVLAVPECGTCRRRHWDPEPVCPYCSGAWHWSTSPGTGVLYSFSVVRRGATPAFDVPYVLALVDLDDGWTFKTNLVDVDHDAIRIGMRLRVVFHEVDEQLTFPFFAPYPAPSATAGRREADDPT